MSDAQWQDLEGKPFTLQQKGRRYQEIAEAIQRSMSTLEAIENEVDNKSLAMDATRQLAADVRADIEKAKTRYAETGEALETYGKALEVAAYEQADPAAWQLRTLHGELAEAEAAERRAANAMEDLPDDATDAERTEASTAATTAGSTAGSLRTEVAKYEKQWTEGYEGKQSAAGIAKSKIHDAVYEGQAGDLNDSTWDKVKDFVSKIYKVFKVICDIAGILAIFFSWVPFVGQVLVALAAVGAILSIIESGVKFTKGEIGFGEMLVGVGLGVLSLFGGKLATQLGKISKMKTVFSSSSRMNSIALAGDDGIKMLDDAMIFRSRLPLGGSAADKMKYAFKTPFTQSTSQIAVREAFENGSITAREAMTRTLKDSFPNPFSLGAQKGNVLGETSTLTSKLADLGVEGVRLEGPWRSAQVMSGASFVSSLTSNTYGAIDGFSDGNPVDGANSAIGGAGQFAGGSWGGAVSSPITVYNDAQILAGIGR